MSRWWWRQVATGAGGGISKDACRPCTSSGVVCRIHGSRGDALDSRKYLGGECGGGVEGSGGGRWCINVEVRLWWHRGWWHHIRHSIPPRLVWGLHPTRPTFDPHWSPLALAWPWIAATWVPGIRDASHAMCGRTCDRPCDVWQDMRQAMWCVAGHVTCHVMCGRTCDRPCDVW